MSTVADSQTDKNDTTADGVFAIAKEALAFVGKFRTPPTPSVYEVWYRYVERVDASLAKQIDHAVHDANDVSVDLLAAMHAQFCRDNRAQDQEIGDELQRQLNGFQGLVDDQQEAGAQFENSIEIATKQLSSGQATPESIEACATELTEGSQRMNVKLADMAEQLALAKQNVASLQNQLAASRRELMTDHLTGVGNRRMFDAAVNSSIKNASEREKAAWLILLDLDSFKGVNDTYGHGVGDQILCFVASNLVQLDSAASVARLGGDEFAVIVSDQSAELLREFLTGIREHFRSQELMVGKDESTIIDIRLSIGAARVRPTDDAETWYRRADEFLYQSKEHGGDRFAIESRTS